MIQIKTIELFNIELPLIEPFIVSYGTYPNMPSIIVKITSQCGLVGWGEAVPDEHVTGETLEGTYAVLKHTLAPAMIGENPMNFEKIHAKMDALIYSAPAAKAA
ncbi:MAG: dipeptide epimerase, partial [Solibacillus sp.]